MIFLLFFGVLKTLNNRNRKYWKEKKKGKLGCFAACSRITKTSQSLEPRAHSKVKPIHLADQASSILEPRFTGWTTSFDLSAMWFSRRDLWSPTSLSCSWIDYFHKTRRPKVVFVGRFLSSNRFERFPNNLRGFWTYPKSRLFFHRCF